MNEVVDVNLDPTNTASLWDRYLAIEAISESVIGETHPRLREPLSRLTNGDHIAAALTYGDILRHKELPDSPDLPAGAVRCHNDEAVITLMEHHITEVNNYLEDGTKPSMPKTLGGFKVVELQDEYSNGSGEDFVRWLNPRVEGTDWYRGYKVKTDKYSAVLIFDPFMQPWKEGGSPFPLLYTIGSPTPDQLQDIASDYGLRPSHK